MDELTQDQVLEYFEVLSNWGRWGELDRRGTLNHITPSARREAAALVREGIVVSCARDVRPNVPSPNATLGGPPQRFMAMTCDAPLLPNGRGAMAAEWVGMLFHGSEVTHLDALSHLAWDGRLFGGLPADTITPLKGASSLAVTDASEGIVARGVLLDVPALHGRPWLEPGEGVRPEHLDAAAERQAVEIRDGDVVLLHTGNTLRRQSCGVKTAILEEGHPGWHASSLPWLHEHRIAAVATDTPTDVRPSGYEVVSDPVHFVGIVAMGLWLIDNCDFAELRDVCSELNRWSFQFLVAPLRLRGGTGSPVNPLACL